MVNPISTVRFCASPEAPVVDNKTTNILERDGAFAKPKTDASANAPKKKSGIGKKILTTVAVLAAVAGALVGLNKAGVVKVLESREGASFMQKVGHYVAVAADFVTKNTWDKVAKLFTKSSAV